MSLAHNPVIGGFFVGNLLASMLFGAITLQAKLYFDRFPSDTRILKTMVAFLWFAQLLEVCATSFNVYTQVIGSYPPTSSPLPSKGQEWTSQYWTTHLIIVSFIVQSFSAYRLWCLSRNRTFIWIMSFVILTAFALEIDDNIDSYLGQSLNSSDHAKKVIAITTLSATIDTALASGLTITLRKQRTGFLQMDRIVNWIIFYGVASGMVTSIYAILILIANLLGDDPTVLAVGIPFGGIYITSMLAQLHFRATLRLQLTGEHRLPTGRGPWLTSFEMSSPRHQTTATEEITSPSYTSCNHQPKLYRPSMPDVSDVELNGSHHGPKIVPVIGNIGVMAEPESETLAHHLSTNDGIDSSTSSLSLGTSHGSVDPDSSTRYLTESPAIASVCKPPPPRFNPTELIAKGLIGSSGGKESALRRTS